MAKASKRIIKGMEQASKPAVSAPASKSARKSAPKNVIQGMERASKSSGSPSQGTKRRSDDEVIAGMEKASRQPGRGAASSSSTTAADRIANSSNRGKLSPSDAGVGNPRKGDKFRCEGCDMELKVTADCGCEEPGGVHFHCCGQEMARV